MAHLMKIFKTVPLSTFINADQIEFVPIKGLGLGRSVDENIEDVAVNIGDKVFKCNLSLLREHSMYFSKHETSDVVLNLYIANLSADTFETIYEWIFQDMMQLKRTDLLDLLVASRQLGIDKLTARIWECLTNTTYFNELDAFQCLIEARRRNLSVVSTLMMARLQKSFLILVGTCEFGDLSFPDVETLLSSNRIGIHTEQEVIYAAMLWIYRDPETRLPYLDKLLCVVRFELLSVRFLEQLELINNFVPEQVVHERILLSICHRNSKDMSVQRFKNIMGERCWVKDDLCPYVSKLKNHELLTIAAFLDYLKVLQSSGCHQWREIQILSNNIGYVDKEKLQHEKSYVRPHTETADTDLNCDSTSDAVTC
ncbi:actin-binding protein IPP-like isoform X2 [Scaptodrosophila lebanonensis]|uniref:Actin-binding protein IPP-like isoform X2 n=1 Tax=Drosophila lebanonensis TaxID=7225 RepID=A0A6J2UC86_DROLE|nr:actin-binding protein IPP-like isoform X2 [Scaptodrosophila lebanonensis]